MKRNWEVIREILTRLEEVNETQTVLRLKDFPKEKALEISYNVELLIEANLVEGKMSKPIGLPIFDFRLIRLTWEGHDFLDAIINNNVWEKTKNIFKEKGISMTFDLVKSIAIDISSAYLKGKIMS